MRARFFHYTGFFTEPHTGVTINHTPLLPWYHITKRLQTSA